MLGIPSFRSHPAQAAAAQGAGASRSRFLAPWRALCLALSLAAAAPLSWGAETVTVNKAFHGREIKVRVGGLLKVELDQAGATGYEWQARDLGAGLLEVVAVETSGPSAPDVTGAPVRKTWLLKVTQAGLAELRFFYYRSWEGEQSAADTFQLKVRIP